jgi:PAS domain S-box-containing protein
LSIETKTLVFNAVPLFVIAVAYAAVFIAVLPSVWRARSRATAGDVTVVTIFPAVAAVAAVYGAIVIQQDEPVQGHLWLSFAAMLFALVPAVVFFGRLVRQGMVSGGARVREAEARTTELDRELTAVTELATALVRTETVEDVARTLIDEAAELLGLEFGSLVLINEELTDATGVVARVQAKDVRWNDVRLDLRNEPSGTARAVFAGAPLAVFDAQASPLVNRRLVERSHAKSIAFVPLLAEGRVLGVLTVASVAQSRMFTNEELALLQALGNEAALALDRLRTSLALAKALERERLIARIAGMFRTQLDLEGVIRVAVEETARALDAQRAFVRLGESGEKMPIAAEWVDSGLEPIDDRAALLPVSNLAIRERRTITVDDVASDAATADPALGGIEVLHTIGTRSALAAPIVVFDEVKGVFALHRTTAGEWSVSDIGVAEAVAREAGLALHIAHLLSENDEQLRMQRSLFRAAQNVTSELEVETVLQRLVDELSALLGLEAADLYLYDRRRRMLRCAAVHGLPEELVGFEFTADRGIAAQAIRAGEPIISSDYGALPDPVPHEAYSGFADAIVAPIIWSGETRGVLGVGARGERHFGDRDADVIGAFASLAALAIRNAETYEERTRQARVQRGFSRIAMVLGEPLSLTATLDAAAQAAAEALGGDFAAVLMPRRGGELELAGAFALPPTLAAGLSEGLPESARVLTLCTDERQVIAAPSLASDERFGPVWKALARGAGGEALLAVPLEKTRAEQCGVVLVFFAREHRFTDDDLELAGQLAHAARGALERSDVYESERSARALAQQLARTGSLLATELDPDTVVEEVAQHAPSLLGADACAVRVLDGDELLLTAASGTGVSEFLGTRSPTTTGRLVGDVFQSRTSAVLADAAEDARSTEADPVLTAGFEACLSVPLVGPEGTVHGVLSLYARRPRTWRKEEIETLESLAAATSAALSNAEVFTSVAVDRERSYAILANIADGIVAVDRESHVVLWNEAAERITGVSASDALDRTIEDVLGRTLSVAGGVPGGHVAIQRGTEEVWLSVTEAVMRDPVDAVAGRIFAFRDISADRLVEEMKSEFVATVSHELRGPLTSIYGFAETLLREDVLFGEEERRTFLTYIASESERLTSIVDALLNVARMDTGDLQVELAPTDVRSVVSEVVGGVQEPTENGHRFVLDLPDAPLAAQADGDKLRQILSALLDNAVKFSPYGGTVTIAARRTEDSVEVTVEDEGVGIAQSEQERIFRKFYRGRDSTAGTGLGLFIAEGLVMAMGGQITVRSEEGKGSQFKFDLPLAPTDGGSAESATGIAAGSEREGA